MVTPTKTPSPVPTPLAPPDEQFWEKYSPHYEFPLSSIGSIALHVAGLMIFLGALYMLSKMTLPGTEPVPMREMMVSSEGDGKEDGAPGSGGGAPIEDINHERPMDPTRVIPDKTLDNVRAEIKDFVPNIPQDKDSPKIEDLPSFKKFAQLNEDLRKALMQGKGGSKGAGPESGRAATENPEVGAGGNKINGDPTSSINRAVRWELTYKTESGQDYVKQLAAMKATLVIPQPPDFQKTLAYKNIDQPRPVGEPINVDQIKGLYFVDDSADSASKVARTLGLNFDPPHFVAFFPKDVEEELAAKERNYRGRKEDQIFSTKFKILIRDGKYTIQVLDQVPVKR
ncbi:hypothetical protein [Zavarzinella formosa]|uniref:hypothetical protein n=1 Tax=Zavarzinella formosa TaxID=360055 RepID=UPI0002D6E7F3|nr:hypothetical protein [Zavarzinella formosa]